MQFRIADTFTDSLAKLTGEEQKAVKTTAFDLQLNPANPGMQFHKLNAARDPNFWSVRVSRDIRLIVHRSASSLLLCYVDHHDKAYQWAERRKLETHPKTGAAQLVEIRERVQEIAVPTYVAEERQAPIKAALFENVSEEDLLEFGVPAEWLDDVRNADEDQLLEIADHLPAEAAEALLELATGGRPQRPAVAIGAVDPFDHPDAQRRFRVMADAEALSLALEYPWEKWAVFLHPAQRDIVEKDYNGPARVSGSAGTGKTIVALHRAVHLARSNPDARVLLTTFSDTLANALRVKLRRLISNEPRLAERLEVHAIDGIGERLYEMHIARPVIVTREHVRQLLTDASGKKGSQRFGPRFLLGEWEDVVDAWQLRTWEDYRDVKRLGRKTRLSEQQRLALWEVFELAKQGLTEQGLVTRAEMFSQLAEKLQTRRNPPFDFAVVDEAQDIGVAQLRFLSALGGGRPNALFFAGDLGQRIFQTPFSWKSLGVDVRGRSQTLRINYRTSHQIRMQADRLLGPEVSDVDGNVEDRRGTVSVFNGPEPDIRVFDGSEQEIEAVGAWIAERISEGVAPHEIGIFVRSAEQIDRAKQAAQASVTAFKVLDEHMETSTGVLSVSTMHLAKGLEFRAVVVMACDDEVIPLQERIESVADDADLQEVYDTERHLLYVACTRARDYLLVTSVDPASEFLDDLRG
ncbi:MAG: DEAD/DEAH box helicase [Halioglobus sp.]|nr:DEAD/DEAH box helicase [Halioglobus sp.]